MVNFSLSHHVRYIVESGVLPVGGTLVCEQTISVCIWKTSRSLMRPPALRRAPPSEGKNQNKAQISGIWFCF